MPSIVVGVDGSPGGELALRFALEEAKLRGLPLRIVCAWETPALEYAGAAYIPSQDLRLDAKRHADDVVAGAVAIAAAEPGVQAEGLAVEGHPASVLVEQAGDAALLVVGSRGRGGFASLVLGSVSQSIAHHAFCPIAIVRAPHGA